MKKLIVIPGIIFIVFGFSFLFAYVTSRGIEKKKKPILTENQKEWTEFNESRAAIPPGCPIEILSDGFKFHELYKIEILQDDIVKWSWKITCKNSSQQAHNIFIRYNLIDKNNKALDTFGKSIIIGPGEVKTPIFQSEMSFYKVRNVFSSEYSIKSCNPQ